ncbi:hypothetical protein DFP72DRAFT_868777 [Ephemerocybe angulata]|uniref:Uncharacterized protein n=1 Tax=Ephemerocybe angulata TaxID=980116 RepID=A0A8H6IHN6_9AGAR|nr:hypothetical protein DFP72DRAFT_868777 [Tulosesus angulatus]
MDTEKVVLDKKYEPDADTGLFLVSKFSDIRWRYRLPAIWLGEEVVQVLIKSSIGQVIYAAAIIGLLESPQNPPPIHMVLKLSKISSNFTSDKASTSVNPFALLDALYTRIIQTSTDSLLRAVAWVRFISSLGNISSGRERPAWVFRQYLESSVGETEYLLENLSSLVHMPPPGEYAAEIVFYHKSFTDFLLDDNRVFRGLMQYEGRGKGGFTRRIT